MTVGEAIAVSKPAAGAPVRGTQLLVEHMGTVIKRPVLSLLEIGWRWLVGIPFLWVFWNQWQKVLAVYPVTASGFTQVDTVNPWIGLVQMGGVWKYYAPHAAAILHWLLPLFAFVWVVVSAVGRNLILMRMNPGVRFRPLGMMLLQAVWLALAALAIWGWFVSVQWTAVTHFHPGAEPELVGFFIWSIFLSLGFYSAFALLSWPFSVAPILMLMEKRSALSALGQGLRLGKEFGSKAAEINMTLGVAKLGIIVLAMVLSAAPLPFADELSPGALRLVTCASFLFYMIANDYFQVVRLRAFVEFRKIFRGSIAASGSIAGS
ncbi:MAG: hypothetical protein ACLGPM_00915 [Acidobacteriota bacterium]